MECVNSISKCKINVSVQGLCKYLSIISIFYVTTAKICNYLWTSKFITDYNNCKNKTKMYEKKWCNLPMTALEITERKSTENKVKRKKGKRKEQE